MVSFKLAAIKVLKAAGEPLHYEEITKRAIEQNLIETTGSTPEATMNAQLAVDIKNKKDKSSFIRTKPGYFELNSKYSEKEEQNEEIEEKIEEEEFKEVISTQYIGKAGEHLVVSELLFRGYNASIKDVDEGIDIIATRDNKLFNIQVKTSNKNNYNTYICDIRISSFEKNNQYNTFYIFVLKDKTTRFLILPYVEIQKNIDQENILVINKNTRYRVSLKIRNDKLYLGNKDNDMSYFMNKWELLK